MAWEKDAPDREERDTQIRRHRHRAALVLRACRLLYAALGAFLNYFPAVCKIVLCLDNDNAGRTRTQDIIAHLAGSGKAVEDRPPPVGKDYNDTLVQYMQEYRAHCISMEDILEETR